MRNSAVFGKTMENVRKYRDHKLVTEKRRNYLLSEPKYHNTEFFAKYLWGIEIRNKQILMNKHLYLGLLILELSKISMYEFCYDYVKPKHDEKSKLIWTQAISWYP